MKRAYVLSLVLLFACKDKEPVDTTESIPSTDDSPGVPDADQDGSPADQDCDDGDPSVYPGATEVCDGKDNNCDSVTDEGVQNDYYTDADEDGWGDGEPISACEAPSGTVELDGDCDDDDPAFHPGAAEADCADPNDYNCDGSVGFSDNDGDGYPACEECDDGDGTVNPSAIEVCDEIDNNCDGQVDEGVTTTYYQDADGDGYGDNDFTTQACSRPEGYAEVGNDCDDSIGSVNPGASEVCNGIDDDCNSSVDEGASDARSWYADSDNDGYGDSGSVTQACDAPNGYVADSSDCDDSASDINPGEAELCNGIDDNCDGTIDEDTAADADTWYLDSDNDGYGDAAYPSNACARPTGYRGNDRDCDDANTNVNPSETEVCNGIDDDCDGNVDGSDAADASLWYVDGDGDGFGSSSSSTYACSQPSGYTDNTDDCDDSLGSVNPDAAEICDGLDNDCDSNVDDLAPGAAYAGALSAGDELHLQYSPVSAGAGYIYANWTPDPDANGYQVAVGTSAGADDVLTWTDQGNVSSATISGLSLSGAWDGVGYYVSVRAADAGYGCTDAAVSNRLEIAEAAVWTGDVADLRPNDATGGASTDWPQTGVDVVWGEHYFESIEIASGTVVRVQGWGKEDSVTESISSSDAAVLDPADGWVALYANEISIDGTITATGAGYGGGGGGCAYGYPSSCYRGHGGVGGLGGNGGLSFTGYAGGGGGGSPGGAGGVGATTGGAGNIYGGGSGSSGCSGTNGRAGGDGTVSTYGGTGGTASSGTVGAAGVGEYAAGGGRGVAGCDNWSGGGGGGTGGGGGGGTQWVSGSQGPSGGGGGGSGGTGGGQGANGGAGAGLYGGSGGAGGNRTGAVGGAGGYAAAGANGDTSTDTQLWLGSGGGGGGSGYQETGGGGGAAGGGAISLHAYNGLVVSSSGRILANGAGGGGGGYDAGGSSTSAAGGGGGGGGILLNAADLSIDASAAISARGGNGSTANGGTIKLFYDSMTGTAPTLAGRVYDAGSGSWVQF